MKIFFNLKPPDGSYGGGAFFVKDLAEYFSLNNWIITYNLDKDIDIIIMIDPRKGNYKKFGINELINYKKNINKNVNILYPVNECDIKRYNSINIEPKILYAINNVDIPVFISNWLYDYYNEKYELKIEKNIINNACNKNFFYPLQNKKINKERIKLVTHHWSDDYLKGFEIYNELDKQLNNIDWIEFTYIGRYYKKYKPKNIIYKSPLSGIELGNELRNHDIYLTASQNEPGGIHQLEGMACGLPILFYKNSGGIKETVDDCGLEFNNITDLLEKLKIMIENYDNYKK